MNKSLSSILRRQYQNLYVCVKAARKGSPQLSGFLFCKLLAANCLRELIFLCRIRLSLSFIRLWKQCRSIWGMRSLPHHFLDALLCFCQTFCLLPDLFLQSFPGLDFCITAACNEKCCKLQGGLSICSC